MSQHRMVVNLLRRVSMPRASGKNTVRSRIRPDARLIGAFLEVQLGRNTQMAIRMSSAL